MRAKYFPGLFSNRYCLHGEDWIKALEPDDLKVFIDIGLQAAQWKTEKKYRYTFGPDRLVWRKWWQGWFLFGFIPLYIKMVKYEES